MEVRTFQSRHIPLSHAVVEGRLFGTIGGHPRELVEFDTKTLDRVWIRTMDNWSPCVFANSDHTGLYLLCAGWLQLWKIDRDSGHLAFVAQFETKLKGVTSGCNTPTRIFVCENEILHVYTHTYKHITSLRLPDGRLMLTSNGECVILTHQDCAYTVYVITQDLTLQPLDFNGKTGVFVGSLLWMICPDKENKQRSIINSYSLDLQHSNQVLHIGNGGFGKLMMCGEFFMYLDRLEQTVKVYYPYNPVLQFLTGLYCKRSVVARARDRALWEPYLLRLVCAYAKGRK